MKFSLLKKIKSFLLVFVILILCLPGSLGFVVKLPHARAGTSLRTGAMVKIGWRGADCRALDGRQGTTTGG